jgi:PAS domain S-box-containing protein
MADRSSPATNTASASILVVEDNPVTREMLRMVLAQAGYRVREAPDAAAALAAIRGALPDLVIQDLRLPDMDGFDLARRLREIAGSTSLPILALSGSGADDPRLAAHGFTDRLEKPVEAARLVQIVQTYLSAPAAVSQPGHGRRVLVADDDPIQRKLLCLQLRQLGFDVVAAEDGAAALDEALRSPPDAIISDVLMPRMDGFGLCRAVRQQPRLARVPMVLASSSYVEQADRDLARSMGANAFVVRMPGFQELIDALLSSLQSEPPRAARAADPALSDQHVQRVMRQLERQTSAHAALMHNAALQSAQLSILAGVSDVLTNNADVEQVLDQVLARCLDGAGTSTGVVYLAEADGRLTPRAQIGYPSAGYPPLAIFFGYARLLHQALAGGEPLAVPSGLPPGGQARGLLEAANAESLLLTPLIAGDQRLGVLVMSSTNHDLEEDWITFAKAVGYQISQAIALSRTVARLAASEQRYRELIQTVEAIVWEMDVASQQFTFVSQPAERLLGYPVEQWRAGPDFWRQHIHPDDYDQVIELLRSVASGGDEHSIEHRALAADGRVVWVRDIVHLVPDRDLAAPLLRGLMLDITQQKRLEEQFHQAQKMEAIGRLAGGVAHDFNNLLTAITGYCEFLLEDLDSSDPRRGDVSEIKKASGRAAGLTRQLLAFSRRQVLAPQVIDLNRVVAQLENMLRRLIGEDVELIMALDPALAPVKADPNQIEQVIMNLIVNARDAMPSGGTITVRTANVRVDAGRRQIAAPPRPGPYSVLMVRDTGIGMDAELQSQIFEPFFTTKDAGKGTGLGLSTVYGIVKQSGGDIFIDSAAGQGATFTIYMPSIDAADGSQRASALAAPLAGSETILVAEDEEGVRTLLQRTLQQYGYRVLASANGMEAQRLAAGHPDRIDLLLTDVVMPGMRGPELAAELLPGHPEMRVLYISGYTDSAIMRPNAENVREAFLQKPFTPVELARQVLKILDGYTLSQPYSGAQQRTVG